MPKVDEVLQRERRRLPKLQKAVLDYLESHPDEVFSWNRGDLFTLLNNLKQGTRGSIGWSIWALQRHGYIERLKVGRRYYYGSREAIRRLADSVEAEVRSKEEPPEPAEAPREAEDPNAGVRVKAPQTETAKAEPVEVPVFQKAAKRGRMPGEKA